MADSEVDLTDCDREPIHIPGSIQPHGMLLVAERDSLVVRYAAGDVERHLGLADWRDQPLDALIGGDLPAMVADVAGSVGKGFVGHLVGAEATWDMSVSSSGGWVLIEMEPMPDDAPSAATILGGMETVAAEFERTTGLKSLCEVAAEAFRNLTGFDRVMVYRFLDDEAGVVLGEAVREDMQSFMNHHFPGSDIPRQARALYVKNLVRVIPDSGYRPAVLRPEWTEAEPLDMSDCGLRSVSPIHLQYLRNMGVAASASVSIVKDGVLWGLIACHHEQPLMLSYDTRVACRVLAGGLSRQIKAKEEAENYRERIRLRGFEDEIVGLLSREGSLEEALHNHIGQIQSMLGGDGVAVVRGGETLTLGSVPGDTQLRDLAAWLRGQGDDPVYSTSRLSEVYPPADAFRKKASGVLSLTVSTDEPWMILWFRAEQLEVLEWAGNPHKGEGQGSVLTPRASFDAWKETVHGRSRRWTLPEVEAAGRLRPAVLQVRQNRRIRELNQRLSESLSDKDALIQQKEFLIGEINHRVQNSLQLVSSFLALQARDADDSFKATAEEARRRLQAVALVHRRLYRGDALELVDAARYLEELCSDSMESMGPEWKEGFVLDLQPVTLPTDRAVTVGLILTELLINANKYAYDGRPGPLEVRLVEDRTRLRLTVADRGKGKTGSRKGFGSRLMDALVSQLGGELIYEDNNPGLRALLTAPLEAKG